MSAETMLRITNDVDGPVAAADGCTAREAADDPQLVARFVAGDRSAAEQVIESTAVGLTRLVQRLLAWPQEVDDVVQDVYLAALANRHRFRCESRLQTWLTRIAINECRRYTRRQWVRRRLGWRPEWHLEASVETIMQDALIAGERAEIVRQGIASLPSKLREVVVLYYLEEMAAREVADVLQLKVGTVEVRLTRARHRLRSVLRDWNDVE